VIGVKAISAIEHHYFWSSIISSVNTSLLITYLFFQGYVFFSEILHQSYNANLTFSALKLRIKALTWPAIIFFETYFKKSPANFHHVEQKDWDTPKSIFMV